jgi:hypothetical protein
VPVLIFQAELSLDCQRKGEAGVWPEFRVNLSPALFQRFQYSNNYLCIDMSLISISSENQTKHRRRIQKSEDRVKPSFQYMYSVIEAS